MICHVLKQVHACVRACVVCTIVYMRELNMYYKCTQEFPPNHSLSFVMYVMMCTHITHKPCNHNYTVCMIISTAYSLIQYVLLFVIIYSPIYYFFYSSVPAVEPNNN